MDKIKKITYLSVSNYNHNFIGNILVGVFTVLAVFFMNISFSSYRYEVILNKTIKESGLENSFMYIGYPNKHVYAENEGMNEKAEKYVSEKLSHLKESGHIEGVYPVECSESYISDTEYTEVLITELELLKALNYPVKKGMWFNNYDSHEKKNIPVVIGASMGKIYGIGDTVTLEGIDSEGTVIGILKDNTLFIEPTSTGNGMNLNSITVNANNMIIAAAEIDGITGNGCIVKLVENDKQSMELVFNAVGDVVYAFSISELAQKASEDNRFLSEMQTTLAVLSFLVCITGMGCNTILSMAREDKRRAICQICGMSLHDTIASIIFEGIIRLFLPMIVGIIIFFRYCAKQSYEGLYVDMTNIALTIIIAVALYTAVSLKTINAVRTESLLKYIT